MICGHTRVSIKGTRGSAETDQTAPGEPPQHLPAVAVRGHHGDGFGESVRDAAVHLPLPGGDLRKDQVVVKGTDLQEGVLSCKSILQGEVPYKTLKNRPFCGTLFCVEVEIFYRNTYIFNKVSM